MRCDRCREIGELTPVALGTLNDGYQFDGYVEETTSLDLCPECVAIVARLWNALVDYANEGES
jgi:hypothetical protein